VVQFCLVDWVALSGPDSIKTTRLNRTDCDWISSVICRQHPAIWVLGNSKSLVNPATGVMMSISGFDGLPLSLVEFARKRLQVTWLTTPKTRRYIADLSRHCCIP
jgi:hypothetical protein